MADGKRNRPHTESLKDLRSRLEKESSDSLKLLEDLNDNPICAVSLDETVPCIKVIWKQYATSTQLRFVHESIVHMLERHGINKVLGDDTALPTIHSEDQVWIAENWMPRAVSAGLRAAASKSPASYFCQISIETIQSVAPPELALRSFDDMSAARQWLKSLNP
jgi:hypothetical protein